MIGMMEGKTLFDYLAYAYSLESDASQFQGLANKALNEARKLIEAGEFTGNPLHDYVVMTTKTGSRDFTDMLQFLELSLEGKIGELILFVYTWEESSTINKTRHKNTVSISKNVTTRNNLHLGILTGNKLVVNPQKKYCDFPTKHLLERGDGIRMFYTETCTSPGNAMILNILQQETKMLSGKLPLTTNSGRWELKVGATDILAWMNENPHWAKHIVNMSVELGRGAELSITH